MLIAILALLIYIGDVNAGCYVSPWPAGTANSPPSGPGAGTIPIEEPTPSFPDFVVDQLDLKDGLGNERYTYTQTETVHFDAYSKNIGEANWDDGDATRIHVKFYLSKGYKEDPHDQWHCVGTQDIEKGHLDVGDTKLEQDQVQLHSYNDGHPIDPGVYNIVACVDRNVDQDNGSGNVVEMHESNNCSTEAVFTVLAKSNLIITQASFANGVTQFDPGDLINFSATIENIGPGDVPPVDSTVLYYLDNVLLGMQDNIQGVHLAVGELHVEDVNVTIPSTPGTHNLKVCADGYNVIDETDETDDCYTLPFEVADLQLPPLTITVTNPTSTDVWRSTDTKHITWTYANFGSPGHVNIQYSMDGGATWRTIENGTPNDGSRYWDMCNSTTVDSANSYIKITSQENPTVFGLSQKFTIDHASGCK